MLKRSAEERPSAIEYWNKEIYDQIIFTFETTLIGEALLRFFTAAKTEFLLNVYHLSHINLGIPFLFEIIFHIVDLVLLSIICALLTVA